MFDYDGNLTNGAIFLIGFFGFIILCWLTTCIVITKEKTNKLIERFGRYNSTKTPGLSLKLPFPIDKVAHTVPMMVLSINDVASIKTADNAFLTIPWVVQYYVSPGMAKEAHYELNNPKYQMAKKVINTIMAKASEMTVDEIFNSKNAFKEAVQSILGESFEKYGFITDDVTIDEPTPSENMKEAFEEELRSERKKRAAQNDADAVRIKEVGLANAEGASLEIKAKAFVKFRNTVAEGNAKAIKAFSEGLTGVDHAAVMDFFAGIDQREALRDVSKNPGTTIVIPADNGNGGTSRSEIISLVRAMTNDSPKDVSREMS